MPNVPDCDSQKSPRYGCYCNTCNRYRRFGFVDRDPPEELRALPPPPVTKSPDPPLDPRAVAARPETASAHGMPPGHVYNPNTYHPDQDYSFYGGW